MQIETFLTIAGIGVTVLIVVLAAWVNIRIAVAKLQVKVTELEKDFVNEQKAIEKYNEKIDETLIKIFNILEDIKIKMASQK